MADILDDLRDRYEYGKTSWHPWRSEAAIDMQYVAGDPWDTDDKSQRQGRPTVAPEEMGQYFNQVINQLWANPRGGKFTARGNGASEIGARFYQNKWREIEYRSNAKVAYTTAASDAIQRSYGFIGIEARYASPQSPNQDLWIVAKPDPDLITIDPEAVSPDSSDMTWAFEEEWRQQAEFKRKYPTAKITNFGEWTTRQPSWVVGTKIKVAKYWAITTKKRQLVLVQMPAAVPSVPQARMIAPDQAPAPEQRVVYADEIPPGASVIRQLREVEVPSVKWHLTNGLEILDEGDWRGKYIPIVSCYGKVLYVPMGGETKRVLLSMTRFGRQPWKAMCYTDSGIVEMASTLIKGAFMVPRGTFPGALATTVQEAMYKPKAFVEYEDDPKGRGTPNGPPMRPDTPNGQYMQWLLAASERFRRGIQSAMGSGFLPTEAQKRSQKSGVALDKIDQAATTGTFHFVNNYEDMIRQAAVIGEDLIPHYYDFAGETGIMEANLTAKTVWINTPDKPDAIPTAAIKGEYLVTVSTGPSSDSEREAVQELADTLVQNIERVAAVAGPKVAAYVLAKSIKFRNGGPEMDALADAIEPPEFKQQDGQKPPDPQVVAMQGEIQRLTQQLQQAAMEKQAKVTELQGKAQIEERKQQYETSREQERNALDLRIAQMDAMLERMALALKAQQAGTELQHETVENARDRRHDVNMQQMEHRQAVEVAQHQAVLAPNKPNGSGASA